MTKAVKSFANDPVKELWRQKIVEFVSKHYTPGQCRDLRVLCLSGAEMREVFEAYDPLGV